MFFTINEKYYILKAVKQNRWALDIIHESLK